MSTKFALRPRARAIWKSKSLKTGRFGALLEVELRKICTTPARESDLEVKVVTVKLEGFANTCLTGAISPISPSQVDIQLDQDISSQAGI